MTVAAMTELFLMNMGYAKNDLQEEDVLEEYSGVLLRWLNEGYCRALRRIGGKSAMRAAKMLKAQEDEPDALDEKLHPLLADYAAARAQELQGNAMTASALYAAFERGIAEGVDVSGKEYTVWEGL